MWKVLVCILVIIILFLSGGIFWLSFNRRPFEVDVEGYVEEPENIPVQFSNVGAHAPKSLKKRVVIPPPRAMVF